VDLATVSFLLGLQAFSLWSIASSVEGELRRLGIGPMASALVIPWLTTLPETITTVKLAASGYPVAGLYNAVYSAVIDLFLVAPLIMRRREAWRLYPALLSAGLFAALAVAYGAHRGTVTISSPWLGSGMIVATMALSVLAGLGAVTTTMAGRNLLNLLSGLAALTFAAWYYAEYATMFAAMIGNQALAGIVNAYLTSMPDIVYAIVAHESSGLAELSGCIIHDFLEAPGFAAALGKLVVGPKDLAITLAFIAAALPLLRLRRNRVVYGMAVFTMFTVLGLYG